MRRRLTTTSTSLTLLLALALSAELSDQAQAETGIGHGAGKLRIALPDFRPATSNPQTGPLNAVFNETLWNDLDNAGIFEMVSKSLYPLIAPGSPDEIRTGNWSNPPPSADIVAFGTFGVADGKIAVDGWLYDVKSAGTPEILSEQHVGDASPENAQSIAHRLADEIIAHLGGGPGVAETRIYYVSTRSGNQEIWAMNYDGANQHQLTHLNSAAITPSVSPDNSRVAFSGLTDSWQILIYSFDLGRVAPFPRKRLLPASPRHGHPMAGNWRFPLPWARATHRFS